MSASTQTAELPTPKQTPPTTTNSNGTRRARAKDKPAPRKAAPKPAARTEAPAPVQAEKVVAAKVPAAKIAATQTAQAAKIATMSPHPLVQGLFQTFPDQGADISEAKAWMDTANAVLKQILKFPGGLTVTAMPSAA
jgi:hypothetical protein